ncbi:hypothetical protein FRC00_009846 [Tulasnella sp. 408]|nr:hypothetical protein FRC00_009846 [Tulasnella sp. 408]
MFQVLYNGDHEEYYTRLIAISGVCSHWYKMIQNSPPLWTLLNFSDPPRVVEMALQRSSLHSLDIVMRQNIISSPPDFQPFMDTIIPHKNRWRHMDIRVPSQWVKGIVEALGGPPPNLKELSFLDKDTLSCARELNLFGGRAPPLNKLTLNGVSIQWDSEVLHNLTALDISWIHFPSTDAILCALARSPQLQKLFMYKCSTGLMATSSSPSVQLSQLVYLRVHFRGKAERKNFLDHLICGVKNAA